MADNLATGSSGSTVVTALGTWSGDSAHAFGGFSVILSGSEGSWTMSSIVGGAGAVSAGVQRMTLASDDPAVSALGATGDAAATQGSTGSISAKLRTVTSQLNTIASGIPVTNAGTFATQAAQSGTWTVGISGTVTVGSHAVTNAGTFAVQVDGAALTALQLIDNIVLAEDSGHSSGDPGVMMFAVRNDSDASLCGTSLDYTPLQVDSNGYLKVNIKAGAGSGGTAMTDDAAYTAASTSFTPVGGIVTADSVDSGDGGAFAMLANRQQKVTLYDSSGVELAVGGGTQYTEDSASAANPTGNALILIREDALAGSLTTADGDNVAARGNNKGELYVKHTDAIQIAAGTNGIGKLTSNSGVTIGAVEIAAAQTLATVTTVSTVTTCSTVTTLANGQTAHDSAVSGSPLRVGAKAETALSGITLVADGDATDLHAGVDGVLITRPHTGLEDITSGVAAITDGSSTSVISAAGAGVKIYITSVIIANSSASYVTVDLRDGTAGSVKATFPAPATGGVVHTLPVPLAFSANTAVAADPSAAASTVTITLVGFKSKV